MVGAYFGNPQLGFALGALAGSALFPTQLPNGPKITDNRTTTSTVGEPVPIGFGTFSVSGTVIWLAPYIEHQDESGGKGGPTQTTYSYTQSIAIGLCERVRDDDPDDVGAIAGVSRIWENGTIVYDIRPQQEADTATGQIAETDLDYANRLTASAAYAEGFTLYLGTEEQIADPTIEAIEGFGEVLAFRALAYIVYTNRSLAMSQGLRHPNFTFECFTQGVGACEDSTEYSNSVLLPWNGDGSLDPRNLGGNVYNYQFNNNNGGSPGPIRDTLQEAIGDGSLQGELFGWSTGSGAAGNYSPWFPITVGPEQTVFMFYNTLTPASRTLVPLADVPDVICDWADAHPEGYWVGRWYAGGVLHQINHGVFYFIPAGGNVGACHGVTLNCTLDDQIEVTRNPGAPPDPCVGLPVAPIAGYCVRGDGRYIKGGAWTPGPTALYTVLQQYRVIGVNESGRGGTIEKYPLNPCLPPGSPSNTEAFWTAAYNQAVAAGQMTAGQVYGVGYPDTQTFAYTIDMQVCTGGGSSVAVGEIVAAICQRAGMTAAQYDVSDLGESFIDGYSISSVSAAVDIISPLRSVAFFDGVESSTQIKFPTRGKEVVATFTTDDFGAYDGGSGSTVPPAITSSRADETTLPRTIRLHYKSVARDYEDDQQQSPFRLTTSAVNDQDLSLPLCLGDTQALQCADIIWADAWAAKDGHELSVDQSWSALEVADCIAVPVDKFMQRLRIVSDTNSAGVLRKLSCVRDNQGSYISYAIANPPARKPQKLKLVAPTNALFLDLPALQDSDSNPGFYMAAQRAAGGNAWNGCQIYRSTDGGATFVAQFAIVNESTVGTLEAAVPASPHYTYDDTTDITVNVLSAAYSFSSVTDAQLVAGANAAAMGADGHWEIVQFGEAVQLSATQWRLSRLLRGRRGTEYNIGKNVAGDTFVLLNAGYLQRELLSTAEINGARIYKVVSIGASYGSGVDTTFIGHAQALSPFSPVKLTAVYVSGADILITWRRRDRLGRTLMSGVDMPLSEATETFQVDIIDPASPEAVLRTLTVINATQVLYSATQQAADFGSSPALSSIKVGIYQMSAVVGRGTGAVQTLSLSGTSP